MPTRLVWIYCTQVHAYDQNNFEILRFLIDSKIDTNQLSMLFDFYK